MPVTIGHQASPKSIPLTSPLEAVMDELGEEWIGKTVYYGHRQVVATIPFPDKLRLTGEVLIEDQLVPDQGMKASKFAYQELDLELMAFLATFPLSGLSGATMVKLTKYHVSVTISDDQGHLAWAALDRRKGKDFGIWSITIEFCPSKVGPVRMEAMMTRLEDTFCMFDFVKLTSRLPISRCDCAIDLYGVSPKDLVFPLQGVGKSVTWDKQGAVETVTLFADKVYPKSPPAHGSFRAHGRMIARIYDRSAYAKWHGLPALAAGIPVTRFEVQRNWKNHRPTIGELPVVKNMLVGTGAGFAWPVHLRSNTRWKRIHAARWPIGKRWAETHAPIQPAILFNRLFDDFPADLVGQDCWTDWPRGVSLTGLDLAS
jgi:hypothetical protein